MSETQDPRESLLRKKLEEDPTDILTYFNLIQLYKSKIEESTDTTTTTNSYEQEISTLYNTLHEKFPYYAPAYTLHISDLLQRTEFEQAEQLLSKYLLKDTVNDLNLWLLYLDYVRRRNNLITGGQEARAVVIRAFELVLRCCAVYEPVSREFWEQYLGFLESWNPVNKWEEQSRVDMIRKLFRVMLCVPFDALESMWGRYTAWEQEVNALTARKFIGEISAGYMRARSLFREWSVQVQVNGENGTGLKRVVPVSLRACNRNNVPSRSAVQGGASFDVQQLEVWKKWLSWERENKLELDSKALRLRLEYVYKQAVQYMVFCPEMWYEYSIFCGSAADYDDNNDGSGGGADSVNDKNNGVTFGIAAGDGNNNSNNNNNNNNNNSNSSSNVNNIISYSSNSSAGRDDSSKNIIELPTGPARSTVLEVGLRANPMSGILTLKLAECYEFANVDDKVSEVFETTLATILARVQLLNERLASETLETSQPAADDDKNTEYDPQRDKLELQSLKERMTFMYCVYMNTVMKLSGLSAARAVLANVGN